MSDCQVNLTIKDGKIRIHAQNTSVEELALMCGALEQALGHIGYKNGASMEEIKTSMLDIHLGAMQDLEKQIRAEEKDGKI